MQHRFALKKFLIYQFGYEQTTPSLFDFQSYFFHSLALDFLKSFPTFQFSRLFPIFANSITKNNDLSAYFSTKIFFYYQSNDFKSFKNAKEQNSTNV
jgi:hypothetical protein